MASQGILNHCTIDLLFDWFEISCMPTDNLCFYLQKRLIQTSQTGGQWYSDTSPLVFPAPDKVKLFVQRTMDKLKLTGRNLGRVFIFRSGHWHAAQFWCNQ